MLYVRKMLSRRYLDCDRITTFTSDELGLGNVQSFKTYAEERGHDFRRYSSGYYSNYELEEAYCSYRDEMRKIFETMPNLAEIANLAKNGEDVIILVDETRTNFRNSIRRLLVEYFMDLGVTEISTDSKVNPKAVRSMSAVENYKVYPPTLYVRDPETLSEKTAEWLKGIFADTQSAVIDISNGDVASAICLKFLTDLLGKDRVIAVVFQGQNETLAINMAKYFGVPYVCSTTEPILATTNICIASIKTKRPCGTRHIGEYIRQLVMRSISEGFGNPAKICDSRTETELFLHKPMLETNNLFMLSDVTISDAIELAKYMGLPEDMTSNIHYDPPRQDCPYETLDLYINTRYCADKTLQSTIQQLHKNGWV